MRLLISMSSWSFIPKVLSGIILIFLLFTQITSYPISSAETRSEPSITILYPTGGETLGGSATISWKAHDLEDTGRFVLYIVDSDDNAHELDSIDCDDGDGTYEYNWDTTLNDPQLQYKIQIDYYENYYDLICSEELDEYFRLTPPVINIISPNGGEILNQTVSITWSISYITDNSRCYLYYSEDGFYWDEIDVYYIYWEEYPFSYNWSVENIDFGDCFKIKVEYEDDFDNIFLDESNNFFSIEPPPSLHLEFLNGVTVKPSGVVIFFSAQTHEGEPVTDMEASDFTVYEDDTKVSAYESQQTILNKEVGYNLSTILLLDMSGSIIESGQLPTLQEAAKGFIEKVAGEQKTGIFLFDGREEIEKWAVPTNNKEELKKRIDDLSDYQIQDPSTNLNGAIIKGLNQLGSDDSVSDQTYKLKVGSLVVFTDGTDQAARSTNREAQNAVMYSEHNVFTIGLGGEIDEEHLQNLGKNGFEFADNTKNVTSAFNKIAGEIKKASQKFYLLAYCSPKRAGYHSVTLEGNWRGAIDKISYNFDADGFESGCDPFTIESDLSLLQNIDDGNEIIDRDGDAVGIKEEHSSGSSYCLLSIISATLIAIIIIITIIIVILRRKKKRKQERGDQDYSPMSYYSPHLKSDSNAVRGDPIDGGEEVHWSESCPRCGSHMNQDIYGKSICTKCKYGDEKYS